MQNSSLYFKIIKNCCNSRNLTSNILYDLFTLSLLYSEQTSRAYALIFTPSTTARSAPLFSRFADELLRKIFKFLVKPFLSEFWHCLNLHRQQFNSADCLLHRLVKWWLRVWGCPGWILLLRHQPILRQDWLNGSVWNTLVHIIQSRDRLIFILVLYRLEHVESAK